MVSRRSFQMIAWKRLVAVLTCMILVYLAYRWVDRQFRVDNIRVMVAVQESQPLSTKYHRILKPFLSTPYTYLDRGKQTYVFVSRDGDYVLKLFDARCLLSGPYPLLIPISAEGCKRRLKQVLKGYLNAFHSIPDDAALAYFQPAADVSYSHSVILKDRFGFTHELNLSEVPFALQRKALQTREAVSVHLKKGNVNKAVEQLNQIVDLYVEGYRKGLIDGDHNVMYNTGFVDGRSVRIDVGRLRFDEGIKDPKAYRKDLNQVFIVRVGEWLQRHFPQYHDQIVEEMKTKITSEGSTQS